MKWRQWLLIPLFGIAGYLAWLYATDKPPGHGQEILFCEALVMIAICWIFGSRDSN
jgi:hypothetical protein